MFQHKLVCRIKQQVDKKLDVSCLSFSTPTTYTERMDLEKADKDWAQLIDSFFANTFCNLIILLILWLPQTPSYSWWILSLRECLNNNYSSNITGATMTQGYCEVRTMLMHGTPETIKKRHKCSSASCRHICKQYLSGNNMLLIYSHKIKRSN